MARAVARDGIAWRLLREATDLWAVLRGRRTRPRNGAHGRAGRTLLGRLASQLLLSAPVFDADAVVIEEYRRIHRIYGSHWAMRVSRCVRRIRVAIALASAPEAGRRGRVWKRRCGYLSQPALCPRDGR